jgi:hypothetical protein
MRPSSDKALVNRRLTSESSANGGCISFDTANDVLYDIFKTMVQDVKLNRIFLPHRPTPVRVGNRPRHELKERGNTRDPDTKLCFMYFPLMIKSVRCIPRNTERSWAKR